MKPVLLPEEMRKLDEDGVRTCGLTWDLLMEAAGRETAREMENFFGAVSGKFIFLVCGTGNNGGDGLCLARWLFLRGAKPEILLLGSPEQLKAEASFHYQRARACEIPVFELRKGFVPPEKPDLLVDAIFGTGLDRPVDEPWKTWILWLNQMSAKQGIPVVSVDIPSGISSATGQILGTAVQAKLTVTMQELKLGLVVYPGAKFAGEIRVVPLGYPRAKNARHYLIEATDVAGWLPRWEPWVHKGHRGKVIVAGGSVGLTGALVMAADSAAHSGAGLTWAAFPASLSRIFETKLTEVMKIALPDENGFFSPSSAQTLLERMDETDALVLGPGIGRSPQVDQGVRFLVSEWKKPLILDADALYVFRNAMEELKATPAPMMLTPHSGEMARLLGISSEEVEKARPEIARLCAEKTGKVVMLKGARTLVANPEGTIFINPTGNEGMATGGSGDILAGMCGAFLGMGLPAVQSACCAAYLHGLAGDIAVKRKTIFSLTALDILAHIPYAFSEVISCESSGLVRT